MHAPAHAWSPVFHISERIQKAINRFIEIFGYSYWKADVIVIEHNKDIALISIALPFQIHSFWTKVGGISRIPQII